MKYETLFSEWKYLKSPGCRCGGDQFEVTGKGIILGEIIEVKTDNDEEILNSVLNYRFWRRGVVFPECLIFGDVGVEIDHLMTIVDSVRETPDHEILPRERLEHRHLLLLGCLIYWKQNVLCLSSSLHLTWAPGDGDSSKLGIWESDEECSNVTRFEKILCLLTSDEAEQCSKNEKPATIPTHFRFRSHVVYSPIYPHSTEVLFGELHHGVEPFPECETSVWKRLFAELWPGYH